MGLGLKTKVPKEPRPEIPLPGIGVDLEGFLLARSIFEVEALGAMDRSVLARRIGRLASREVMSSMIVVRVDVSI